MKTYNLSWLATTLDAKLNCSSTYNVYHAFQRGIYTLLHYIILHIFGTYLVYHSNYSIIIPRSGSSGLFVAIIYIALQIPPVSTIDDTSLRPTNNTRVLLGLSRILFRRICAIARREAGGAWFISAMTPHRVPRSEGAGGIGFSIAPVSRGCRRIISGRNLAHE